MQAIMDQPYEFSDKTNEQSIAAKQRFESFKLGSGRPTSTPVLGLSKPSHGRSHSRSHSRNTSINSISSMSNLSLSTSTSSVKSTSDMSTSPTGAPPKQRPNSHHRRRSSVSTRRESAELMGVTVPDLPQVKMEDNINLGDKDSIRRRALLALEGKGDLAFSKVEIPDLKSPEKENTGHFSFPTKPSFPAGSGAGFGSGLSAMAEKRSSVGKFMTSASSKDQLGTLVEEEEEEEDSAEVEEQLDEISCDLMASPEPLTPTAVTVAVTKPSPARPRPASLNLRPLALTSGSVINPAYGGLPTPTLTPGAKSAGLKSLSLATSQSLTNIFSTNNNINDISTTGKRRQSLNLAQPPAPSAALTRRPSLNINCESPTPMSFDGLKRHSSISYKSSADDTVRNLAGLPTPEATPIMPRRQLGWGPEDEESPSNRPLSTSEQHFLFKSHNALLARITDLESALSYRTRSRPVSVASDVSSSATSEPSDEMLSLITDLKAERDELKRDVDGWRTRVADLEDKVGVVGKRVEAERREAWVARSRLGLLEVEKTGLEKALDSKSADFQEALGKLDALQGAHNTLKAENEQLRERAKRVTEVEDECARLRAALEEERSTRDDLEKAQLKPRPMFKSMDSEASLTDVEPCDDLPKTMILKAVTEEEEDDRETYDSDDDNGLAGYEDEEDSDMSFESPSEASIGSMDEYTRAALRLDVPRTPSLTVSDDDSSALSGSSTPTLTPSPHHRPNNSLSKAWTFPSGCQPKSKSSRDVEEVDHFFGCLEDLDNSPPLGFMDAQANSQSLFSQSLGFSSDADSDDEMPPFVLPSHVGVVVETPVRALDVLIEEDEEEEEESEEELVDDEFEGEEYEGGIKFTFNAPTTPDIAVTPPAEADLAEAPLPRVFSSKTTPVFVPYDDDEETSTPFTFGRSSSQVSQESAPSTDDSDGDVSFTSRVTSPSSIPRSTALRSFTSSTPTKASSRIPAGYAPSAFMTPPSKRGGTMPSFIPQPVASPLKTKSKAAPTSTFLRQPQSKPVPTAGRPNVNNSATTHRRNSSSQMINVPLADEHPDSESSSNTAFSSIMSFQSITNWWTPRSGAATTTSSMTHESSGPSSRSSKGQQSMKPRGPIEKKYVSKDKQMEKLRIRMDQERKTSCRGPSHVDVCRTCTAGIVYL